MQNLHVTLLDSCSILDSMWNSDHKTSHHTHKSLDSGTLLGAHRTVKSSTPIVTPPAVSLKLNLIPSLTLYQLSHCSPQFAHMP